MRGVERYTSRKCRARGCARVSSTRLIIVPSACVPINYNVHARARTRVNRRGYRTRVLRVVAALGVCTDDDDGRDPKYLT